MAESGIIITDYMRHRYGGEEGGLGTAPPDRKPPIEDLTVEELRTALLNAEERLSLLRDRLNTALTDKHDLQRHHEQLLAAHVTVMAEVKRTGLDSPWED